MKIELVRKSAYGRELLYIRDKNLAQAVRALTGRKTVTEQDLQAIRTIAYEVATNN